ncbi:prepilin-type N-terminal cleavage/methylation domain-containing protein [Psychromonas sp. MME2]|uniref:type IV pilus modification PilV family protein n=1 Tax=unclassified Psychromonas TaxID=2614957 RepID=UPI00339C7FDA
MKDREYGFTLFEVLVAMFITGVALLGLAQLEVYILKSSQSSFNYTVASIRANSFVDAVWMDLCNAQDVTSASTYTQIRSNWVNDLSAAGMTTDENSPPASITQDISVTVKWSDPRFIDEDENNTLTLETTFPDSGCG